jgi:hypothetical protein
MQATILDFGTGALIGGLALSAGWGCLWLSIGTIGYARGVCSLRIVLNSLAVGIAPLLFGWLALWMRAESLSVNAAFAAGLLVMPMIVVGLALRRASDGRRAGLHMAEGIRQLKNELLGVHQDCGGCAHDHDPDRPGGCS